jgi:uncharacterized membrane protein
LGLAIFFMAQIAELLWRRRQDRPLMLSLMALAGFFAALTFPLAVTDASLTICWALLACMFLWLGTRLDSAFVRWGAYVLYLVVVGRLLLVDFERDFGAAPAQTVQLWMEQMARRLWTSGTVLLSLWGAFHLRRHRILGYGGLALAILYMTLETRRFLYVIAPGFVAGGTSVVWTIWAIGLLISGIARDARSLRYAGLAGFTVVVGKVFLFDLAGMPMMYRVLAFMVVGVCSLLGAFAYLRAARQFKKR